MEEVKKKRGRKPKMLPDAPERIEPVDSKPVEQFDPIKSIVDFVNQTLSFIFKF